MVDRTRFPELARPSTPLEQSPKHGQARAQLRVRPPLVDPLQAGLAHQLERAPVRAAENACFRFLRSRREPASSRPVTPWQPHGAGPCDSRSPRSKLQNVSRVQESPLLTDSHARSRRHFHAECSSDQQSCGDTASRHPVLFDRSCGGQPMAEAPGQEPSSATLEDSSVVLSSTNVEAASAAGPTGDVARRAANCSRVQFCNAPGPHGTRCVQRGCSSGAAENECKREVRTVCRSALRCPLFFIKESGVAVKLGCPPTVCAGGAIECGGRCCGTSATFCAGTRCCDGIHCGGACPC